MVRFRSRAVTPTRGQAGRATGLGDGAGLGGGDGRGEDGDGEGRGDVGEGRGDGDGIGSITRIAVRPVCSSLPSHPVETTSSVAEYVPSFA